MRMRGEIETILRGWGPALRMIVESVIVPDAAPQWCHDAYDLCDRVESIATRFAAKICNPLYEGTLLVEELCELHNFNAEQLHLPSESDTLMTGWQKNLACMAVVCQKAIDVAEKQADLWGWPECRDCGAWFPECEEQTCSGHGDRTGTRIARTCDACRSI